MSSPYSRKPSFAAGVKYTLGHVEQPLPQAPRLALYGGAAVYLAGHAAFRLGILGTFDVAQLIVAAALLIIIAATASITPWAVVALLALAVWALVGWELVQPRRASLLPPSCRGSCGRLIVGQGAAEPVSGAGDQDPLLCRGSRRAHEIGTE